MKQQSTSIPTIKQLKPIQDNLSTKEMNRRTAAMHVPTPERIFMSKQFFVQLFAAASLEMDRDN